MYDDSIRTDGFVASTAAEQRTHFEKCTCLIFFSFPSSVNVYMSHIVSKDILGFYHANLADRYDIFDENLEVGIMDLSGFIIK